MKIAKKQFQRLSFLCAEKKEEIIGVSIIIFILLFPIATFAQSMGTTGTGWTLVNTYGLPEGTLSGIITNILSWLLKMFSIFGVIGFVLSGIFYLISAGNDDMITKAKEGMTWSIVGIIVGLSGLVIMQAVFSLLDGASTTF